MTPKPFWKEVFLRVGVLLLASVIFALILTTIQYAFDLPNYVARIITMIAGVIFGLYYHKRYAI